MPDLVTLVSAPHLLLVRWRNVVMLGMRVSPNAESIEGMSREAYRLRDQGHRGAALVHLVRPLERKPPPPDAETREAYLRMMRDKNTPIRCSAVVMTDSGFTAALARSVLTGLMLVARPAYATKVFSSEREASGWICAELDEIEAACGPVEELHAAILELDRRLLAQ